MKNSQLASLMRDAGSEAAGMFVALNVGPPPSLEEAQRLVGGFVEMITLDDGDQLLVDEDGRIKGLPVNSIATLIAKRLIVGRALLLCGEARWS